MISPEFPLGEEVTKDRPSDDLSPEQGEEVSHSFPVLLVLGGGWAKTPDSSIPGLSRESHMRVLAAGEMFKAKITDHIIFAGGKTAGDENPSEAEAMKDYLQKKYPEITDESVILEDGSLETSENMENTLKLLDRRGFDEAMILTSETHLKRAEQLAQTYLQRAEQSTEGNKIKITAGHTAEDQIIFRSPRHYEKFVENYTTSSGYKLAQVKEFILRSLLIIDREGKIPRYLAHKTRKK